MSSMTTPMLAFVQERGNPTWRSRAERLIQSADRQIGPDAIDAIEPVTFEDGSVGIATLHQRKPVYLAGSAGFLVFAAVFYIRALRPTLVSAPADALGGFVVLGLLVAMSLVGVVLYLKAPGANALIVVDRLGGYAAWRTGLRFAPKEATFDWRTDELRVGFETRRRYSTEIHSVRVLRYPKGGSVLGRQVFSTRIDDLALRYWQRFDAAAEPLMAGGAGAGSTRPA
jgi:hypothetical protein